MSERELELVALQERWAVDARTSELGLWWLVQDISDLHPEASDEQVQVMTLWALSPLLESGALCAVDLLEGGAFRLWEGSATEVLHRITSEWRRLGRRPDLGEIVWFISGERAIHH